MTKYHGKQKLKNDLIRKQNELISKIKHQRFKLHEDLYKLKQRETKENGTCNCRAKICKINHSRFRWHMSEADMLFNSLSNLSSIEKTEGSYSYVDIEFVNNHLEEVNEISDDKEICPSFICATCSKVFDENINIENYQKSEHEKQIKCSRCDKMFYTRCEMSNHF